MSTQPLTPRQIDILEHMERGDEYQFPGKDPFDRAKRKFAALDKLRKRGYVDGAAITDAGRQALEMVASDQITKLAAIAGSRRKLAKAIGVRPEYLSRWGRRVPEQHHASIIEWGQSIGLDVSYALDS